MQVDHDLGKRLLEFDGASQNVPSPSVTATLIEPEGALLSARSSWKVAASICSIGKTPSWVSRAQWTPRVQYGAGLTFEIIDLPARSVDGEETKNRRGAEGAAALDFKKDPRRVPVRE